MYFGNSHGGQMGNLESKGVCRVLARPSTGLNHPLNIGQCQQGLGQAQNTSSGYGYRQTGLNRNIYQTGSGGYSSFQQNIAPARPYVIIIKNNSPLPKPFVLFGASDSGNFGNTDDITIESPVGELNYVSFLGHTMGGRVRLKRIRVECLDSNRKNIENSICLKQSDAFGKVLMMPLGSYIPSDSNGQFVCEIPCDFDANNCTEFSGTLEAYSSIKLSVYPDRNYGFGITDDRYAQWEKQRVESQREADYQRLKQYLLIVD